MTGSSSFLKYDQHHEGVVDDLDFVSSLDDCVSAESTSQIVFRVMHKNPHSQKVMDSVSLLLRPDHVAVAMYDVTSFNVDPGSGLCMTASSSMSAGSKITMLSLDTFLNMTMPVLKERMLLCKENSEPRYHLQTGRCPANVDGQLVSFVLGRLVDAEAYPGPCKVMYTVDGDGEQVHGCLEALAACGLVVALPGPSWQLTPRGLNVMKISREVSQFHKVFHVRASLPYAQRTQWELLDELLQMGWQLEATTPRKRVKAIELRKDVDVVATIVFTKKALVLPRSYLTCLLQTRVLALQGHAELKHRQPVAYYAQMLGEEPRGKKTKRCHLLEDKPQLEPDVLPVLAAIADVRDDEESASVSAFDEGSEDNVSVHHKNMYRATCLCTTGSSRTWPHVSQSKQ